MNQQGKPLYQRYKESQNSVRTMTPVECAWLACAIDGEGCIGLYNTKAGRRVVIGLFNTDERFVAHGKEIVGDIGYSGQSFSYGKKIGDIQRKKLVYSWRLNGSNRCYAVLKQILPYMIIKTAKANAIIKEVETYPFGRWSNKTEEGRAICSNLTKLSWQNPEIRMRRINGMKGIKQHLKEKVVA